MAQMPTAMSLEGEGPVAGLYEVRPGSELNGRPIYACAARNHFVGFGGKEWHIANLVYLDEIVAKQGPFGSSDHSTNGAAAFHESTWSTYTVVVGDAANSTKQEADPKVLTAAILAASYGMCPAPSTWVDWNRSQNAPKDVEAFFNTITVTKSHVGTFFMTNGSSVGYMGLQDRDPKWVIFSIWDQEGCPAELVESGPLTRTSGFSGEGTGGKSWLEFEWELGVTYSLCISARPDRDGKTLYSGYFLHPAQGWLLIASFRTKHPTDGPYLCRLSSFVEDWLSEDNNGAIRRECKLGPPLVRFAGREQAEGCIDCRSISQDTRQSRGYLNRHVFQSGDSIVIAIGGDAQHECGTELYCGPLKQADPDQMPDLSAIDALRK